jgi:hypothetical protein
MSQDFYPVPLTNGVARSKDGETSYQYAVYDKRDAETEFGRIEDGGHSEFAEKLTGWYEFYRGAGRAFGQDPVLKVYGKKILVYQLRGLDI